MLPNETFRSSFQRQFYGRLKPAQYQATPLKDVRAEPVDWWQRQGRYR